MSTVGESGNKNQLEIVHEFFKELNLRFNISVNEWCKAKNLTYNTVSRLLRGERTRDRIHNKVMREVAYWNGFRKKK